MATTPAPLVEGVPPEPNETDALKAQIAAQGKKLDQMERFISRPPAAQPTPQGPPPAGPDPKALENEFWKNPLGMTAALVQRGVQEAVQQSQGQNYDLLLDLAKGRARGLDPDLFDKYEMDVEAKVNQVHPQFRTNPVVWINAFNTVKGEKIQEILRDKAQSPGPAIRIPKDGPSAPSPKAAPEPAKRELTPDELEIARRLRISPDAYRHGIELYEGQSDKGNSSWDGVMTFDSELQKGGAS